MKKLEVEMYRYDNILFGKVLHMDEELRGKGRLIRDAGGYQIISEHCPNLTGKTLFVNGIIKGRDGVAFYREYNTEADLIRAAEHFKELIDKINGDTEETGSSVIKVM